MNDSYTRVDLIKIIGLKNIANENSNICLLKERTCIILKIKYRIDIKTKTTCGTPNGAKISKGTGLKINNNKNICVMNLQ